jgi:hypothetical protein
VLADESGDSGQNIDKMCELILAGPATDDERSDLLTFIRETRESLEAEGDEDAENRAWSIACHALFASSRFQFVE